MKTFLKTYIITIILSISITFIFPFPTTATTQLPKASNIEQALTILNHQFPDWNANFKSGEFDYWNSGYMKSKGITMDYFKTIDDKLVK